MSNGIYIASKTKYADRWKILRESGVKIISTWIDEVGEAKDMADLERRCRQEVLSCSGLIVYASEGDILKGAFIEMGIALAVQKPVILVGNVLKENSVFTHNPCVLWADTVKQAVDMLNRIVAAQASVATEADSSTTSDKQNKH